MATFIIDGFKQNFKAMTEGFGKFITGQQIDACILKNSKKMCSILSNSKKMCSKLTVRGSA